MNSNGLITIRDTSVARENLILVEPFDPAKSTGIPNPERFAGRALFRDGTSMLTEQTPQQFAADHGFRFLGKPDNVATNPDITFRVQAFHLVEAKKKNPDFKPERDFASRLVWGKGGRMRASFCKTRAPPSRPSYCSASRIATIQSRCRHRQRKPSQNRATIVKLPACGILGASATMWCKIHS